MEHKFSTKFILFYSYIKMPQGKGTYGTKRGRPPTSKADKAKEMKDKRSSLKKTKAKPLVKKPMKKKM